jgi:hypothetical protein
MSLKENLDSFLETGIDGAIVFFAPLSRIATFVSSLFSPCLEAILIAIMVLLMFPFWIVGKLTKPRAKGDSRAL